MSCEDVTIMMESTSSTPTRMAHFANLWNTFINPHYSIYTISLDIS